MPKLNDVWIRAEAGDGEKLMEKCAVSVTTDGVFTIQCPDKLIDTARAILKTSWTKWPAVNFDCSRNTAKITTKLLADCSRVD